MQSWKPVIRNRRGREAELNSESTQEHVGLAIKRKRAQRPVAHEAEVRVMGNDIGTEPVENPVVKIGAGAFEPAVACALLAHGEDDLGASTKCPIIFETTDMSSCRSASREITASAFPICASRPASSAF